MEKNELDAIVLTDRNNVFYTSGAEIGEYRGPPSSALILPLKKNPILMGFSFWSMNSSTSSASQINSIDQYTSMTVILKKFQ